MKQSEILYTTVLNHLAENTTLLQLFSMLIYNYKVESIDICEDKLIGAWDEITPGRKIKITWTDPYRVEYGFIFTLPGLCENIFKGAIVQIPESVDDPEVQRWYPLAYLAAFVDTLELEPEL